MGCDQKRILAAHVMHGLGYIRLSNLLKLCRTLPDPELDSCIPASTYDDLLVICEEAIDIFDRLSMRTNVHNLVCVQVPLLYVIVRMGYQ